MMKPITMMLLLLAFATGASAQTKNPAELDQFKAEYLEQLKSTLDPINRKYLQQFDALKKKLGGKGDLAGAQKVQKQIEAIASKGAMMACVIAEEAKNPAELDQLNTSYQAQVKSVIDPINQKYFQQLDALKKKLGGQGDLESAQQVQKEIEDFFKKSKDMEAVNAVNNATVYALCDDGFTFCVNGKEICSGGGSLVKTEAGIKRGDIITVRVIDTGVLYGFACVIKFKDNKNIKSDTKTWKSYTPMNKDSWFDVKGIMKKKPATDGNNKQWKSNIVKESKIDCDSIWGETMGTSYLVYEVK
ncbi:MAG: hypothetical protein NT118_13760 [Lentisphaerae bacterium]|nr:hypothetical protein [Lentisphaerota bacterium]